MPSLTTHILDMSYGVPAEGVKIELFRIDPTTGAQSLVTECAANSDGRTDRPLLTGDDFKPGQYALVFNVSDYFKEQGRSQCVYPFLQKVPVHFGVSDATQHYHVPLLVSPYGYTTYRGN